MARCFCCRCSASVRFVSAVARFDPAPEPFTPPPCFPPLSPARPPCRAERAERPVLAVASASALVPARAALRAGRARRTGVALPRWTGVAAPTWGRATSDGRIAPEVRCGCRRARRGQDRLVHPVVAHRAAVAHGDQGFGHLADQVAIVADQQHGARVGPQRVLQHVAALQVEMVGRLVEHQQVDRVDHDLRQRQAGALAAGEVTDAPLGRRHRGTRSCPARCAGCGPWAGRPTAFWNSMATVN